MCICVLRWLRVSVCSASRSHQNTLISFCNILRGQVERKETWVVWPRCYPHTLLFLWISFIFEISKTLLTTWCQRTRCMTNRKNCTSWITLIEQGLCLNWATETYIIHIYVYVCVYICIDAYIHINIYAFSCYRPLFQHSAKLPSIVRCSVTAASITLN